MKNIQNWQFSPVLTNGYEISSCEIKKRSYDLHQYLQFFYIENVIFISEIDISKPLA